MHLSLWTPHHTQGVIGGGHVLISGAPGAGKSHLLREAIIPGLVASGAQVLVIDYADVIGAKIKGLRREVYGEETFGVSNPNAASPAADLLGSSAIATLASERAGRDAMADLLLRSLYVELVKHPPAAGGRRFLVVDISHQSSALSTFGPLLREAVKHSYTLIVTCQSPSTLDDDLLALFSTHVGFYHFFKRCLKTMAQALLSTDPSRQISGDGPMPKNHFGQPLATPASQLATDLSRLKVGECILGLPGAKLTKLKLNPWG
jgi:hypothetical protein